MKLENAEPDVDMYEEIDSVGIASIATEVLADDTGVNHHDIRASLAIINGYSVALQSSFQELRGLYNEVIEHKNGVTDETNGARLMTLEADCRFCLSRMSSSVEQLKKRLEADEVLQVTSQN